ncbi:MAG: protease complex subunit PrcB family protein [Clostridiaceae bacterium]|nr:protease complex subunit PrcB family protein [Clostridiaceae bacterium]
MQNCKIVSLFHMLFFSMLFCCLILSGCSGSSNSDDTTPVEFTIVTGADIPSELQELISEREKNVFELTYSDNGCLYIIKGYGKQKTGGYSIVVNDFYQSGDDLILDTDLFGPEKDDEVSEAASYPYIVIKTEYRENPVVFQ